MALALDPDTYLLVLTGAGISAESGVPTFRDAGGLWEGNKVEDVASPDGFARDPLLVWRFYSQRRANMTSVEPNAGHRALVDVETRLGERFLLVTQNVDGLHGGGSRRMIEIHGNLMTSRCTRCDREPFEDRTAYREGVAPMCGRCKERGDDALLRPHIVWFGETIATGSLARIEQFVDAARGRKLAFLAVGTSGVVYPAAGLVDVVRSRGGRTWLVNAERPANANAFDEVVLGPAGVELPAPFAPLT